MTKDKHRRHLEAAKARKARRSQTGRPRAKCENCGLAFDGAFSVSFSFYQELKFLEEPEGPGWTQRIPCPRCGAMANVVNVQSTKLDDGSEWVVTASSDAELARIRALLEDLKTQANSITDPEDLAQIVAPTAPRLAKWIREHKSEILISVLIEIVIQVLMQLLSGGDGVTVEQLEEILEEHSTEVVIVDADDRPREQESGPKSRGRRSSGGDETNHKGDHGKPPHDQP